MTMQPRHPYARSTSRRDGGYVFLLILMLITIAAITSGASLERASMQTHLTQMQIEGYERYHELQGVKTIAQIFLFRQESQNLQELANTGRPVQTLRFDDGLIIKMYVQDGQGTILRNTADLTEDNSLRFIRATLSRIPEDRLDLTRTAGPWKVSLRAAPDGVLMAMAGGDHDLYEGLREARDEEVPDSGQLIRILDRHGVETPAAQAVARNIIFQTSLWRIDLEVVRPNQTNYYTTTVLRLNNFPRILEWDALSHPSQVVGFGSLGGRAPPSNVVPPAPNNRRR